MATITPSSASGSALTYAAATAGGDTVAFGNASRPVILVRNNGAGPTTVTVLGTNACSQNFLHNQTVTCPVGDTEIVPAGQTISTATATLGQVSLTYSSVNPSRSVSDGATTASSTTVTSATAAFTSADVGATVVGGSIPASTTIASVTNATTVVLSAAATATATGVSLTISKGALQVSAVAS